MRRHRPDSVRLAIAGRLCAAVALSLSFGPRAASAQVTFRKVAVTDDPASVSGVTFLSFEDPFVDALGRAAFEATLQGTGVSAANNDAIFSEGGGAGLTMLAREGDEAPGKAPGAFTVFRGFLMGQSGHSTFNATQGGSSSSSQGGVWSDLGGGVQLLGHTGDSIPGHGSQRWGSRGTGGIHPRSLAAGLAAINTDLSGVIGQGVTHYLGDGLGNYGATPVEGDAAPGFATGEKLGAPLYPQLNRNGLMAFTARITKTGGVDNPDIVWTGTPATGFGMQLREGGEAPGLPGVEIDLFTNPSYTLNDAGRVAAPTVLTGTGVTTDNDRALLVETATGLAIAVREDDTLPDLPATVRLSTFGFPTGGPLNAQDEVAFSATLRGNVTTGNDSAIFAGAPGSLRLIAREGDPDPDGGTFRSLRRPSINSQGDVVFETALTPGIFADLGGRLITVIKPGDQLDAGGGVMKTVNHLSMLDGRSTENGTGTAFNDARQMAFVATFADNSQGVFVANVPEPSTLVLTLLALLAGGSLLLACRRPTAVVRGRTC